MGEEKLITKEFVARTWNKLRKEMHKPVIGMERTIESLFIAILTEGHVLLEGPPGIAKTLAAQNFAKVIGLDFNRIQMTPDLLPADLIGTTIFNQKTNTFQFKKGPIFSNVILIDEINRAPPKTQAALLEVMEEKTVTIEGTSREVPRPFLVLATQNPVEMEGTFPLPEAQISRFMVHIIVGYPNREEERKILELRKKTMERVISHQITSDRTIFAMQDFVQNEVRVSDEILDYIRDIVINIRQDGRLSFGCSPRASIAILSTARVYAAMQGRDWVRPDDIKHVALPALRHRLALKPEIELSGTSPKDIVLSGLRSTPAPK